MKKLSPSILSADFSRLKDEIQAVEEAGADYIHIDVMDGHFVPNITIGPMVVEAVKKITSLPLDVHLMISDPDKYIEPSTDLYTLEYTLEEVDMVLLMTVNPGFGGQKFIPGMIPKIKKLRRLIDESQLSVELEVDGGINLENIGLVSQAGADVVVSGSAVFKSADCRETVREMKKKMEN
ncbi:MAG: ribulose-phosphate 3-epimerase [Deltaproteobacteria bacterium]|nr:ribulose-phosphate 3-epimerase [Deltaproteobacteria bacterium]